MQKMVAEIKAATAQSGSGVKKGNRYEYDSDEEVEEGTWEHKARIKEMKLTEGHSLSLSLSLCLFIHHRKGKFSQIFLKLVNSSFFPCEICGHKDILYRGIGNHKVGVPLYVSL